MSKAMAFIIAIICCMCPAVAQKWTPHYIGMTSTTHGYNEYLPEGYKGDGTAVYPLILYIHGNSERGTGDSADLERAGGQGIEKAMSEPGFPTSFTVNKNVYRFIVIAPQFDPRPMVWDVDSVLNYVLAHYPIDVNRIYLSGFSMGGGSCWDYAGAHPAPANKLAALLPISGSGIPDTVKTRTIAAANLPVWATHNDSDGTVPVSTTITYVDWINKAPAPTPPAKKTIFHAAAHNAWAATYKPTFKESGLNVFEWLLQYKHRTTVLPPKQIKVNVYGGLNTYMQVQWNNWNVTDSLSSANFRYSDATASTVQVTLSKSTGMSDNGLTYGGGMAPAEVLRYTSSSSTVRTLTLSGLSAFNAYSLELYASRNNFSGNVTVFTVNGSSQNISTYKNLTTKAVFTHLKPNTAGQILVTISNANSYNYLNGFVLTEEAVTPNQAPVANAGTAKTITLPANSLTLSGSGSDPDGSVKTYKWAKAAGPLPVNICTPAGAITTVSGLAAGIYTFQLTVTDNAGATANDEVQVTVKPPSTKYIRVNLYGGSNPYTNSEWNNWNIAAGTTSAAFTYYDGSVSTVTATLQRRGVSDNGASYGGCMTPPEVLRYSCYASTPRTLTLNGLSPSKTYTLELYASRGVGTTDSTIFTINGVSKKVGVYQNRTTPVSFTGLQPNAQGVLTVNISATAIYNHLNGFTLIESGTAPVTSVSPTGNLTATASRRFPDWP